MRLDLFLKKSGLIKRRKIAKEMIEFGLVKVNDAWVKPSFDVVPGVVVAITFGSRLLRVKVNDEMKVEEV